MRELLKKVEVLAEEELARANNTYPQFSSFHEGWAVILEEMEEAEERLTDAKQDLSLVWWMIKNNEDPRKTEIIKRLKNDATQLAAEAIQVMAMCLKLERMGETSDDHERNKV